MLCYQVVLTEEQGAFNVSFPQVQEALTFGSSREEALANAVDALLTAFMVYAGERRAFPLGGAVQGKDYVVLPVMAALKVFLHNAMVEKGWRKVDLARATGWTNTMVERALDPRYQSKVPALEEALQKLGKVVVGRTVDI